MNLCQDLLSRVQRFYPNTELRCELTPSAIEEEKTPPPRLTRRVAPVYSPEARRLRVEGTVLFRAIVGSDGRISDVELLDGPLVLYEPGRDAVLQWQFDPKLIGGNPVATSVHIELNFHLR